jgi:hypothetical protein
MNRHSQSYFDLNPEKKPPVWRAIVSGLAYLVNVCAAALAVYVIVVFAFSL